MMRKNKGVLLFTLWVSTILIMILLGGCSGNQAGQGSQGKQEASQQDAQNKQEPQTKQEPQVKQEVKAVQEPSAKPAAGEVKPGLTGNATAPAKYAALNSGKLKFEQYLYDYFKGDVDAVLDKIQPLLLSAVKAKQETKTEVFITGNAPFNYDFEWMMVYHLINDYGFDRQGVTQENGGMTVPAEVMTQFYSDAFGMTKIAPVPNSLSGLITYDQKSGVYKLISADGGGTFYRLKNISLSLSNSAADPAQSAKIVIEVMDKDDKVSASVCVEILPSSQGAYPYTLLAVYPPI